MFRRISQISLRGKLLISGIVFLLCLGALFTANTELFGKVMASKSIEPKASNPAFDPGDWVNASPMPTARNYPASSFLPSGKLLVVGGIKVGQQFVTDAAIYDPAGSGSWQAITPIPIAHRYSAQLLNTGDVLVVGDDDNNASIPPSSFLYTETPSGWSATNNAPSLKRYQPALALLTTGALAGHVLMTGGYDNNCCTGAIGTYKTTELYNPTSKTWSAGPSMNVARLLHTATTLNDGRVLVVGGAQRDPLTAYNSAELYTPGGSWTVAAPMAAARYGHTATRLPSGEVLVVGGANGTSALNSVELYNPTSGTWVTKTPMTTVRYRHTATLLPSGKVLVAGGENINGLSTNSAELYDPATNTWSDAGPLNSARGRHIAALLPCGRVIVAGGTGANGADLASSEIYTQKDPLITLFPTTLANGVVGQMFMQPFSNTGAMAPLTYSLTGTLPKGMTLQSDGKLTGIPEEKGVFSFTVKVTDKNGCMGTVAIRWQVDCPNIVISPTTVHNGVAGQVYSPTEQLSATGGTAPYSYAVTSGMVPTGMSLTTDGKLQGTPMQAGNFSFQVTVTDKFGCTGIRVYPLTIACDTITITPENMQLPDAMQAMEYNPTLPLGQTFKATGGCGDYSFSISAGQLPPGMSLSPSGALSGIPTKSGDHEFTVKVTDKCGCMTTKIYKLKVTCPFRSLLNQSLFNTGVSNSGTLLADGAKDPHYNVNPPNSSAFVVAEYPGWILNSDSTASKWISHSADKISGGDGAEFSYTATFTLSSCDPNSVVIQGRWAADNSGDIYVNGTKANSGGITGDTGFKQWQSFTLNSSTTSSAFSNSTTNTIEFRVKDFGVASGLRVEFQSAVAKCCGCTPPPRNAALIGWWPLDGDAKEIRSGRDGVITNGAFGAGMVKGGWKSSGQGSVIDVGNAAIFSGPVLTLDAWIRVDAYNILNMPIVGKGNPAGQDTFTPYSLFVTGTSSGISGAVPGQVGVLVSDCVSKKFVLSSTVIPLNSLKHVAATISKSEVKIYIDGVLSASEPFTLTPGANCTSTFNLQIGGISGATHENFFNGLIDELEYWNDVLTEDQIRNIYSAFSEGKCKCVEPPQFDHMVGWWPMDEFSGATVVNNIGLANDGQPRPGGTVGSATDPISVSGMVNGALYFDGLVPNGNAANVKHVRVPADPAYDFTGSSFSIDAWINPDLPPTGNTDAHFPIVDKLNYTPQGTPQNNTGYAFYVTGTQLVLDMGNNNGSGLSTYASASNVVAPTGWQHVAVVVTVPLTGGTTGRFYINGQPSTSFNVTSASPNNTLDLLIGRSRYNPPYRAGAIDELEIFNTALTAQEVLSIYEAKGAGKCKPPSPCTNANITLTSQPNPLPMGTAGVVYSDTQFTAAGGTGPYMYSATGLPPGLTLSMDGKLTGTPTQQGNFTSIVITVKDANGCTAEFRREINVKCRELNIKPEFLPAGFVGAVYPKQTFTTDSACLPVTYTTSGNLPPGLTFVPNGMLQGTPTTEGSFTFTVSAIDACGCPDRKTYTVVIKDCPRVAIKGLFNTGVDNSKALLTTGVPDGHYTLTAQNGSVAPPVVVAPANGWVTSSAARWIGRPGGAGGALRFTTQFDLSGCDLSSVLISGRFAASLSGQLFLNSSTTPIAQTPANGATGFTNFTITSGFQAGPNTLTFVTTAAAQQGGLLVEFTEATAKCCDCPAITIGPNALSVGNLNQAYGPVLLTASGGMAPYTYSLIGGGLPAGMTLSSAGAISGTPTAAGNFVVKVLVVDAMGCTGMRQYDLRIRRRLVSYSTSVIQSSSLDGSLSGEQTTTTLSVTVTLAATAVERRWKFGIQPTSPTGGTFDMQSSGLSNPRAFIGPDAAAGQLTVNNSQIAQNRLGLEIAMPTGQTVGNGDKHVFTLLYDIAPNAIGSRYAFEFIDEPTSRGIFDVNGNSLPADFSAPQFVLAPSVANVSAASYQSGALAPEEIVSAFGVKLATATVVASSVPLPTMLAGTTVKVKDSANVERFAPLFFVAPTQINYMIPAGTAPGVATVLVTSGDGTVSGSAVEIAGVAPGVFVADASGRGLPAANALTFRADGSSGSASVARFDTATNKFVAVPIDLGTITDRVFLSLFATGVRKRTSLDNVRAIIGGVESPVFFAGDQGGFAGLDQINIEIPRSLAGSGLVDVTLIVDGQIANVVQVNIR